MASWKIFYCWNSVNEPFKSITGPSVPLYCAQIIFRYARQGGPRAATEDWEIRVLHPSATRAFWCPKAPFSCIK